MKQKPKQQNVVCEEIKVLINVLQNPASRICVYFPIDAQHVINQILVVSMQPLHERGS